MTASWYTVGLFAARGWVTAAETAPCHPLAQCHVSEAPSYPTRPPA